MMPSLMHDVDLAPFTTFAVPAKAADFVEVKSLEELKAVLASAGAEKPRFILGGGSNVLFTKDFAGLVIRMKIEGLEVVAEDETSRTIRAGAGCDWSALVDETLARGWPGLENLALVPGTVGGAAVQNIGAYGLEAAERIVSVECLDARTLETVEMPVDECDYGYRSSVFKRPEAAHLIVTAVTMTLPKAFEPRIEYKELAAYFAGAVPQTATEVAEAVKAIRRRKLPDPKVLPNAGSFFKNPVVTRTKERHLLEDMPTLVSYSLAGGRAKLAAGWLIEAVGMKGERRGNAGVYERQALVLVNHGGATGAEIKALADEVADKVWRRFGVKLEPEPVIL